MQKKTSAAALLTLMSLALTAAVPSAMAAEKVLFEDAHVRFLEVTHWPGDKFSMAPIARPWIIAADGPWPALSSAVGDNATRELPTQGKTYPWCQSQNAQPARSATVTGDFPLHYYRMEYKRIDGDGFAANWQDWYAPMMKNIPQFRGGAPTMDAGPQLSAEWPFPLAYSPLVAAPANHYLRYSDNHVELVEVFIRPGETEKPHGHPLSSVFFDDGGGFYPVTETTNEYMRPESPAFRGKGQTPPGEKYPTCYAANPQWVHSVTVTGKVPQHFFRLHFRRMDGDDIQSKWALLYPKGR